MGVISTMQFSIVLAVITFVAQKRRVSHQAQPASSGRANSPGAVDSWCHGTNPTSPTRRIGR